MGESSIAAERMDCWVGLVLLQRGWTGGWVQYCCREDGLVGGSRIAAERMDCWVGLVLLQRGWTGGWV